MLFNTSQEQDVLCDALTCHADAQLLTAYIKMSLYKCMNGKIRRQDTQLLLASNSLRHLCEVLL